MKSLSFGEILWDVFDDYRHIGGAAFNFAAHLAKLGAQSSLVSAVGADSAGQEARGILQAQGVNDSYLNTVESAETGTVSVALESGQPSYTIREGAAWDFISLTDAQLADIGKQDWDIFYFGTLAQRSNVSRKTLAGLLRAMRGVHRFYDVNLRQNYFSAEILKNSMENASIVKLNHEEAALTGDLLETGFSGDEYIGKYLLDRFELTVLIITRGKAGARVFTSDDVRFIPAVPVDVADAVGAGDSFSAAFMFAMSRGKDAFDAAGYAARLGSFVASRSGAVPEYSDKIIELFSSL